MNLLLVKLTWYTSHHTINSISLTHMPLLKRLETYKSASVFYHVGNALKYLMRSPRKNGLEDLKKAKQSIEFAIKSWEGVWCVRAIYSYRNKTTLKHLHHITDIPLNTLCYQKRMVYIMRS